MPWGPLGYVTFKRTYARRLSEFEPDATGTEEWWQTCRRVIDAMFDMQKQHVYFLGLEWNDSNLLKSALLLVFLIVLLDPPETSLQKVVISLLG